MVPAQRQEIKNSIANSFYTWFINPGLKGSFLELLWRLFSSIFLVFYLVSLDRSFSRVGMCLLLRWEQQSPGLHQLHCYDSPPNICHLYIFGFADHTETKNEKIEFSSPLLSKILGISLQKRCQLKWHSYVRELLFFILLRPCSYFLQGERQ